MDRKKLIRSISFSIILIFALPFSYGKLTGLSNWVSPFLMLNSVLLLKSFVILNLLGFIILGIAVFKKRWFCNYLCPVGYLQDLVPKSIGKKKRFLISRIPNFNKWFVAISFAGALFGLPVFLLLDPVVIFNGFFVPFIRPFEYVALLSSAALPVLILLHLLVPHLWCEKFCPLGGLQLIVSDLKNLFNRNSDSPKKVDEGRRLFIGGTLGIATTLIFPDITENNSPAIRPPGSIQNKYFNALCIRCGSCIKACPTKILRHETRAGMGLLTPVIKFNNGYCLENCNSCGSVCPSGAITKFSTGAKKDLKIARVVVSINTCLLMKLKECGICKNACHYDSIDFKSYNESSLQMKPVVDHNKCNGCGACSIICPENCFKIEVL